VEGINAIFVKTVKRGKRRKGKCEIERKKGEIRKITSKRVK
jgi:hypothetical protein